VVMKNILKVGAVLGAIAGILAITNPNQEEYAKYLAWHLKENYCQDREISTMTKVGCATIAPLPPSAMKSVIKSYTYHNNYLIFSVYSTDVWGMKSRAIGIGGNFWQL